MKFTTTEPKTLNPLRGIALDAPHYQGQTPRAIWRGIVERFAAMYRRALPTDAELGNAFERGMTPGETWAVIAASRKAGCAK